MLTSKIQHLKSTIAVVGAGNMGQALIKGLLAARVPSGRILAVEANAAARQALRRLHVRTATLAQAAACDVLVLAVKPQDLGPVLAGLREGLQAKRNRALVISIAAGVTLASLERRLGRGHGAVVRVMPNLPAKVGAAVSAIAPGHRATAADAAITKQIFQCVGEVVELPERLFDAVTAVSGSGPAYFFTVFKALRDAGVRQGLPKPVAARLAVQTALGSVRLVMDLGDDFDRWITQVASKHGTTEAALKVFQRQGLSRTIDAGVRAAARRSKELSSLFS